MESNSTISFTVNNQTDLSGLIGLLSYTISAVHSNEASSFNESLKAQIQAILQKTITEVEYKELMSAIDRNYEQMKTKGLFDQAEEIAKNSAEEFKLNLS